MSKRKTLIQIFSRLAPVTPQKTFSEP